MNITLYSNISHIRIKLESQLIYKKILLQEYFLILTITTKKIITKL